MDETSEADADDGIPSISLDVDTRKRIMQRWKHCLIGKVVGKTVGFKFMSFKVNELWKPSGKLQILDLGFDFFFSNLRILMIIDFHYVKALGLWVDIIFR